MTDTPTHTEAQRPAQGAARQTVQQIREALDAVLTHRYGLWGASFLRILTGATLLVQLVVNFPFRSYLWGPAAAWSQELHATAEFPFQRLIFGPTVSATSVTVWYVVLIVAVGCFMVGWHTRLATVLTLVLHTWMTFSDGIYLDQSDNFVRFVLVYALGMCTWAHWSFDARRVARRQAAMESGEASAFTRRWSHVKDGMEPYVTALHNAALAGLAAHICMIYVASAMFKIQGDRWQNGTAVFSPLQIPHFSPFPELSTLATMWTLPVVVATYLAVYAQLFFPLMMLHPVLRKVGLIAIIGMHTSIGVLMGLPFFSILMLAGDSIFVSSRTYQRCDNAIRPVVNRVTARLRRIFRRGKTPVRAATPPGATSSQTSDGRSPAQPQAPV